MFELVYTSIAKKDINKQDITDLLQEAQSFNKEHGITGCLLFHGNEFLQILEGEKDTVKKLYAKIANDKRHKHVTLIIEKEEKERVFADWSMAYHELSDDEINELSNSHFKSAFLSLSSIAQPATVSSKTFWIIAKLMLNKK